AGADIEIDPAQRGHRGAAGAIRLGHAATVHRDIRRCLFALVIDGHGRTHRSYPLNTIAGSSLITLCMLTSDAAMQIKVTAPALKARSCHGRRNASSLFFVTNPNPDAKPTPSPYPIMPTVTAWIRIMRSSTPLLVPIAL